MTRPLAQRIVDRHLGPKTAEIRTAGAIDTMYSVLEDWLAGFIKEAASAFPKSLTADGVRWVPMRRGYAEVEASGYSKSDLEAKGSISALLHGDGTGAQIHLAYKDVMMMAEVKADFKMGVHDQPQEILTKVGHFFGAR